MLPKVHGRQPLVWREAVEPAIDFCVSVLLADGLRVAPFDTHPGGSGELQAAGLAAPDWRAWLHRVVAAREALSRQAWETGDLSRSTANAMSNLARHFERAQPPNTWIGPDAVGQRLRSLWTDYEPEGEAWRRQVGEARDAGDLTPRDRGRLWRALDRDRKVGGTLTTYLVRYPTPVVDVVSRHTLVVAMGAERGPDIYLRLLREGIARMEDRRPDRQPT